MFLGFLRRWIAVIIFFTFIVWAGNGLTATPQNGEKEDNLSEGALTAYTMPPVTIYGVPDLDPTTPVLTRFGTQFNSVTEEQIKLQGSLDFYDALRNVPGVMFQKKNVIGGQTSHSFYMRGRGASHPSPDLHILFDDVPRSGVLYGQALADGVPIYALGGMEVYKSPQPSRFGSGYGMVNFIPKYMTEDGYEFRVGFEGGSFGTFAENVGIGAKKDAVDIYAAQSWISTVGHEEHTAAHQASYYGNLGISLFDNWNVRLLANKVVAQTQSPTNPYDGNKYWQSTKNFDTNTTFATLSLNNDYDIVKGYIKGYYNNTLFKLLGESNNTKTSKQTNILYGIRGRETLKLWQGSEIVLGCDLDVSELRNQQKTYATGAETTWDFPSQTLVSPYLAVSQTFGSEDGFHITPSGGLRYYASDLFRDYASPQAGIIVGYDKTNFSFSYARGVNYPSPVILQGFLANTDLPDWVDTKKIKPEVVDHYEISLSHEQPDLFSLSATYFHDYGRDRLRAFMYGSLTPATYTDFFTSSTSEYTIDGLELTGSIKPIKNLDVFAGGTWLWAKAKGDDGITQHKMPYTPSFALQTGFKWRFLEDFLFSGDFQHLQGVYAGTAVRTSGPKPKPSSKFNELTDNEKLPDINLLNLRLDYFFKYDDLHLEEGRVFVAVNNVLNCQYAYAMETQEQSRELYYMPGTSFMAGFELKF